MWYEQFYSGIVTAAFVAGALYASGATNYWDNGRLHRRDVTGPRRDQLIKRDHRLTGNYYVINGLESIKD
uniref:NADH dehydrogenase [ubiquinone] 1 alpha subcomplex subunit 1 n=1 Tax=Panagrolaimus sp. JU765 TaxID=591449 RepID=A0AC34QFP7_9BILA